MTKILEKFQTENGLHMQGLIQYYLNLLDERRRIVAYLDSVQARLASVRESHKGVILQSATGEELDALLPSVLVRAFKGVL